MDTSQQSCSALIIPLTLDTHQIAQQFYQHHSDAQKARQVYLNTLSICAVNFYLSCLGVETDLEQSQSWNPILQTLSNTADLWINHHGRLECCPVLPNMEACLVPPEAWSHADAATRIGYIFVQLNAELTEANLLGFTPTVTSAAVPLNTLHSLDEFPQFLSQWQQPEAIKQWVVLSHWFTSVLDAGWKTLDALQHHLAGTDLAYQFRHTSTGGIKRGKLLSLHDSAEGQLILLVGIIPGVFSSDHQITIELYPSGSEAYLPRSLHLMILDEAQQPVLQADGSNSQGLEFQFLGEVGEQFTIRIQWQNVDVQERFEI